jgi:hypothetical protein
MMLGGYLASVAISNGYYPASNRGPGLGFSTAFIDIAANTANGVLQEFILRRLTPAAKRLYHSTSRVQLSPCWQAAGKRPIQISRRADQSQVG